MAQDTFSRSLHDVGLAAWFGGTLANAVALNPAAGEADSPRAAGSVANTGWNRWTPVNATAIAAHLAGSVGELIGNRSRLALQPEHLDLSGQVDSITRATDDVRRRTQAERDAGG